MRAYNVFRCKRADCVYCAVPRFLSTRTWTFSGKIDAPGARPVGFDEAAAGASVRFNGFYLFHVFAPL